MIQIRDKKLALNKKGKIISELAQRMSTIGTSVITHHQQNVRTKGWKAKHQNFNVKKYALICSASLKISILQFLPKILLE